MLRIELKESEKQELEERLKKAKRQSALIYMDLKIIKFSNQGTSVSKISELLELHSNTVRSIIKKFKADGFAGLQRKPRGPNMRRYKKSAIRSLKENFKKIPGIQTQDRPAV